MPLARTTAPRHHQLHARGLPALFKEITGAAASRSSTTRSQGHLGEVARLPRPFGASTSATRRACAAVLAGHPPRAARSVTRQTWARTGDARVMQRWPRPVRRGLERPGQIHSASAIRGRRGPAHRDLRRADDGSKVLISRSERRFRAPCSARAAPTAAAEAALDAPPSLPQGRGRSWRIAGLDELRRVHPLAQIDAGPDDAAPQRKAASYPLGLAHPARSAAGTVAAGAEIRGCLHRGNVRGSASSTIGSLGPEPTRR